MLHSGSIATRFGFSSFSNVDPVYFASALEKEFRATLQQVEDEVVMLKLVSASSVHREEGDASFPPTIDTLNKSLLSLSLRLGAEERQESDLSTATAQQLLALLHIVFELTFTCLRALAASYSEHIGLYNYWEDALKNPSLFVIDELFTRILQPLSFNLADSVGSSGNAVGSGGAANRYDAKKPLDFVFLLPCARARAVRRSKAALGILKHRDDAVVESIGCLHSALSCVMNTLKGISTKSLARAVQAGDAPSSPSLSSDAHHTADSNGHLGFIIQGFASCLESFVRDIQFAPCFGGLGQINCGQVDGDAFSVQVLPIADALSRALERFKSFILFSSREGENTLSSVAPRRGRHWRSVVRWSVSGAAVGATAMAMRSYKPFAQYDMHYLELKVMNPIVDFLKTLIAPVNPGVKEQYDQDLKNSEDLMKQMLVKFVENNTSDKSSADYKQLRDAAERGDLIGSGVNEAFTSLYSKPLQNLLFKNLFEVTVIELQQIAMQITNVASRIQIIVDSNDVVIKALQIAPLLGGVGVFMYGVRYVLFGHQYARRRVVLKRCWRSLARLLETSSAMANASSPSLLAVVVSTAASPSHHPAALSHLEHGRSLLILHEMRSVVHAMMGGGARVEGGLIGLCLTPFTWVRDFWGRTKRVECAQLAEDLAGLQRADISCSQRLWMMHRIMNTYSALK